MLEGRRVTLTAIIAVRAFLDGLDASPIPPPVEERCLAALRPRMLDLARERTAGAHMYSRRAAPSGSRRCSWPEHPKAGAAR
jgi:hypothetical protein